MSTMLALQERFAVGSDTPPRILARPRDERGWPVPWFVAWIDGKPDFRVIQPGKFEQALNHRLCWVCGEKLGSRAAFVVGPMCAVTRTTSEPPCHRECAEFAAQHCPFLANPRMRRNAKGMPEDKIAPPGEPVYDNPGGCVLWLVHMNRQPYRVFKAHGGNRGVLIQIGEPEAVGWYAKGQPLSRAEAEQLLEGRLHVLREQADKDPRDPGGARRELEQRYIPAARQYLPAV